MGKEMGDGDGGRDGEGEGKNFFFFFFSNGQIDKRNETKRNGGPFRSGAFSGKRKLFSEWNWYTMG